MLLLPQFVQENVDSNLRTTLGFLLLYRFITKYPVQFGEA